MYRARCFTRTTCFTTIILRPFLFMGQSCRGRVGAGFEMLLFRLDGSTAP